MPLFSRVDCWECKRRIWGLTVDEFVSGRGMETFHPECCEEYVSRARRARVVAASPVVAETPSTMPFWMIPYSGAASSVPGEAVPSFTPGGGSFGGGGASASWDSGSSSSSASDSGSSSSSDSGSSCSSDSGGSSSCGSSDSGSSF